MKNLMPYLIVIAASFLLSGAVVVGTLFLMPDLLKGSPAAPARPDSTATAAAPRYLRQIAGPTFEELDAAGDKGKDSLAVMRDSVSTLLATLAEERNKSLTPEPVPAEQESAAPAAPAAPDTLAAKRQKSRARMLEAMPAEDAARIIARLPDDESKSLLQFIKARQAAKILAAIEPEHASRLLR